MLTFNKKALLISVVLLGVISLLVLFIVPIPRRVSSTGAWYVLETGPLLGNKTYALATNQENIKLKMYFNNLYVFRMEIKTPPTLHIENVNGQTSVLIKFDEWNDFEFFGTVSGNTITLDLSTELFDFMTTTTAFVLGLYTDDSFEYHTISLYGFGPSFLNFQVKVAEQLAKRTGISKDILPYLP